MIKLGRNDRCWCESGKKYKNCHLGRDKAAPYSSGEAHRLLKTFTNTSKCSVPEKLRKDCNSRIVKAHTLSKGNSLKSIAHEGHVLGIKHGLGGLEKNKGRIVLERIGINQASTFTGFCSHHDKELFSSIEDRPFVESREQCTMLAYRPLIREVYVKEANYKVMEESRNFDRGMSFPEQLEWARMSQINLKGAELSLQDLSHIKNKVEISIEERKYNVLNHFILRLIEPPKIMACGVHGPFVDINGKDIQNIDLDENVRPAYVAVNLIALDGKGYMIFSWLPEDDEVIMRFISSIQECPIDFIGDKLTKYTFTFFENIFCSEVWWEKIGGLQERINEMMMQGVIMNIYNFSSIENDNNNYQAINVQSMTLLR